MSGKPAGLRAERTSRSERRADGAPAAYGADFDPDLYYQVILDGLGRHHDLPWVRDIIAAINEHRPPDLPHALSKKQLASKQWLVDALAEAASGAVGTVYVLGGWYGTLASLLLDSGRLDVERVVSVDIEPSCAAVARTLNRRHGARFAAETTDMRDWDFSGIGRRDVVVNTSCEHLDDFAGWFASLPAGPLIALQSNDLFEEPVHVNCVADLSAFKAQAPFAELLYEGTLPLKRYTRFMLIGRR